MKSTNHDAPHCVVFSSLLLLPLTGSNILLSSQELSCYCIRTYSSLFHWPHNFVDMSS